MPKPPLPIMYVDRDTIRKRKDWFLDYKYKKLSDVFHNQEAKQVFIPLEPFEKMLRDFKEHIPNITGIRLYFASYGTSNVPTDLQNTLTVVFAPTQNKNGHTFYDTGEFYSTNYLLLNPLVAEEWVDNYLLLKLPALAPTVVDPVEGDTKSIVFDYDQLYNVERGLLTELEYQKGNGGVTGFRVHFVSYTKDEPHYPQRLTIAIVFTELSAGEHTDFFLEERDSDRPKKEAQQWKVGILSYDTGNPCPPRTCGGATLNP